MATIVNESMASAPTTGTLDTNTGTSGWSASGYYILTTNVNQYSDFYYNVDITSQFTMDVDMQISSTSGADSMWFFWGSNARPHTEGDSTNIGYLLERNEFDGFIRLRYAGSELKAQSWTKDTNFDTLEIIQNGADFTVNYAGSPFFTYTDPSYPRSLPGTTFGWGARCGGTGNNHRVKNLLLNTNGGGVTTHFLSLMGVGT